MKTFRDYGIDVDDRGSGERDATCPKCSHQRAKKGAKCLRVNLDKGTWFCHHCGWTGGLPRDTGMPPPAPKTTRPPAGPRQDPGAVKTTPLTPAAAAWLVARGISQTTAEAWGLASARRWFQELQGEADCIAIPFLRDGVVVNWKFRCITAKLFTQIAGGPQVLYGWDMAAGNTTLVLTEGELDTLACAEAGVFGACSCPAGAPALHAKDVSGKLAFIDDAAAVFEGAARVILAGDTDEPGIRWQQALADKLGPDRCLTVHYPDGCKDIGDVLRLHGATAVADVVRNAKPWPVSGIGTFAEHREAIIAYWRDPGKSRGLSTGWPCLDEYVRLKPGQLVIVTGIPGSGKSEFIDGLMVNTAVAHGWKWAVFSPENYPVEVHFQKLAEKATGKPLHGRWHGYEALTEHELNDAIDTLSQWIRLIGVSESGMTIDTLLSKYRTAVVRDGVNACLLDPYNELEHRRPASVTESEYVSEFLSKIRNFGRLHNCLMVIVAHPTKLERDGKGEYPVPTAYDISGSANWRNKADVCLTVWRAFRENPNRQSIYVQKMRDKNCGKLGKAVLEWEPATGRLTSA